MFQLVKDSNFLRRSVAQFGALRRGVFVTPLPVDRLFSTLLHRFPRVRNNIRCASRLHQRRIWPFIGRSNVIHQRLWPYTQLTRQLSRPNSKRDTDWLLRSNWTWPVSSAKRRVLPWRECNSSLFHPRQWGKLRVHASAASHWIVHRVLPGGDGMQLRCEMRHPRRQCVSEWTVVGYSPRWSQSPLSWRSVWAYSVKGLGNFHFNFQTKVG